MDLSPEEQSDELIQAFDEQVVSLSKMKQYKEAFVLLVNNFLLESDITGIAKQWAAHFAGEMLYLMEDFERSYNYLLQSHDINTNINHDFGLARNEYMLGAIWDIFYGDMLEANRHYNKSIQLYSGVGFKKGVEQVKKRLKKI